jgi:transposase
LSDAVPEDHLVRKIDTALDLSWLCSELAPQYSSMGRPSIDPELMIRKLVVGYVFAIRSERLLCREAQVNLACRWFCRLGIEDAIPDHSVFSRARNERFREGDGFRRVFERVVEACIASVLVAASRLLNNRARSAIVKSESGEADAFTGAPRAHVRYLQRDGVNRDGAPGKLFDPAGDEADGRACAERWATRLGA